MARITSISILFALTFIYDLQVHQMDAKSAFLNNDLNEEVYMEQLTRFMLLDSEKEVYNLVKSLNGLKQSPK